MTDERPCCAEAAARMVKKLTIGRSEVGIANLENVLKEVAEMKLTDDDAVKRELLKRVRIYNYVAASANDEYAGALLKEYKRPVRRQV